MASSTEVSPALEMSESAPITSEEKTPAMSRLSSRSEDSLLAPAEAECLDQSYRPHVNEENTIDTRKQQDEESSSSTWELMLSLYLPLMLLGFQHSFSITGNLVRSLLSSGNTVQIFFGNMSEWMTEKSPWLKPLFSKGGKGTDPHAWPPAALAALAILTVVALVVHPDGFTWVMLSRLRYVFIYFNLCGTRLVIHSNPIGFVGHFLKIRGFGMITSQSCPCIVLLMSSFCDCESSLLSFYMMLSLVFSIQTCFCCHFLL